MSVQPRVSGIFRRPSVILRIARNELLSYISYICCMKGSHDSLFLLRARRAGGGRDTTRRATEPTEETIVRRVILFVLALIAMLPASVHAQGTKPNILVIMGDD